MRYGFVIDHRKCIGCHACTVACKEENQVPLGVNRTWVKYIEKGTFPDTRRYFSVMRCNHCDNAPCVTICPTVALYRRPDGIVDFDGDRCIGCKSCMQACPYDALYIDPETQTAAKCHYCAHRVEVGLEPACVIVCPVQAIIAGGLDHRPARCFAADASPQARAGHTAQPLLCGARGSGAEAGHAGARQRLRFLPIEPDPRAWRCQCRRHGAADGRRGCGSSAHGAHGIRRGASRAALGLESLDLSLDQVGGGRRLPRLRAGPGRRAGLGRRADRFGRPADRARVPGSDDGAARPGPQATRALSLSLLQAQLALVAGLGRLDPAGLRRGGWWLAVRRVDGSCRGAKNAGLAHGAAGRRGRRVQRISLRPGRGARLLAEPAAASSSVTRGPGCRDRDIAADRMGDREPRRGDPEPGTGALAGAGRQRRRARRRALQLPCDPGRDPRRANAESRAIPRRTLGGGRTRWHRPAMGSAPRSGRAGGLDRRGAPRPGRSLALGRSVGARGSSGALVMREPLAEPLHPVARDLEPARGLNRFPPAARWDDWEEYDSKAWPRKVKRRYSLIPTICFNCEAACGLLAYVDKTTLRIQKFEGNPEHPGSRGRNCAKGPATLNQVTDPERILYPLRRAGKRGEGKWERVSWDEALDDIAGRIRKALQEGRQKEIMYHLGRPGHELVYLQRVFHAWGIDGHNSHTNVCSASARAGYAFWHGMDRPSPDHANARFILLLSSHLETGHYFNPHAQRIMEAKQRGAKVAVVDSRLSNPASMADWWLAPWPGSESAMLLAMARISRAREALRPRVRPA